MLLSKMGRFALLLVIGLGLNMPSIAQDNIRVMVHNLLRYGAGGIGTCNPTSPTDRNNQLIDILSTAQPDIYGVNEIGPAVGPFSPASNISINILPNVPGKGAFYEAAQINFAGGQDICNMLWYNSQKLGLVEQQFISASNARNIDYYRLYYKSPGVIATGDTAFLHVFLTHHMASSSSGRLNQSNAIVNFITNRNFTSTNDNYIVMGDFNEDTPNAGSIQALTNPPQSSRRVVDPLAQSNWNQNYLWSQSTRSNSSSDCGSGGGLDDRFDIIYVSEDIMNDPSDFSYVPGSYWVFGNDNSPNPSLPALTRANLIGFSDHYPVILDLQVSIALSQEDRLQSAVQVIVSQTQMGQQFAQISVPGGYEGLYNLVVRDVQGKTIREMEIELIAGVQRIELGMEGTTGGIYILQLEKEGASPIHRKFVRMD